MKSSRVRPAREDRISTPVRQPKSLTEDDDLLTEFRAFHGGRAGGVLTELREGYKLLLLTVLFLLQGSDPVLAQAIAGSREAIWGVLADPASVQRSNLLLEQRT